jgi:hypothetical protein
MRTSGFFSCCAAIARSIASSGSRPGSALAPATELRGIERGGEPSLFDEVVGRADVDGDRLRCIGLGSAGTTVAADVAIRCRSNAQLHERRRQQRIG